MTAKHGWWAAIPLGLIVSVACAVPANEEPTLEQLLTKVATTETANLKDMADGIKVGSKGLAYASRGRAYLGLGKIDLAVGDLERAIEASPKNGERHIELAWALLWQLKAAGEAGDEPRTREIVQKYEHAYRSATTLDKRISFWSANGAFGKPLPEAREADAWLWLALNPPDQASGAAAVAKLLTPTEVMAQRVLEAMWNPALMERLNVAGPALPKLCAELVAAARKKLPKLAEDHAKKAQEEQEELRTTIIKLGVASGDLGVGRKYAAETYYFNRLVEVFAEKAER